ncbi:MAG TPA: hypothetical protein VKU01_23630 [Bryobacteraceae bacterium]|nr:hypothetical protein [Bryobacteraceae bacterium]
MEIPGRSVAIIVDLAKDDSAAWAGSATVPGLGVKGAPLAHLTLKDNALEFTIAGVLGDPAVKAQIAGDAMTGEFAEAGNTAPLTLHKTGVAQVDFPPKSTRIQQEFEGEWTAKVTYGGNPLTLRLALKNEAKAASATLIAVRTKENPIPVTLVRQEGRILMLEGGPVALEASFDRSAGEIRGTVRIGGIEMPITLRKELAR